MWYLNDYGTEQLDKYYLEEEEHDRILREVVYKRKGSKKLNSWDFVGSKICREVSWLQFMLLFALFLQIYPIWEKNLASLPLKLLFSRTF